MPAIVAFTVEQMRIENDVARAVQAGPTHDVGCVREVLPLFKRIGDSGRNYELMAVKRRSHLQNAVRFCQREVADEFNRFSAPAVAGVKVLVDFPCHRLLQLPCGSLWADICPSIHSPLSRRIVDERTMRMTCSLIAYDLKKAGRDYRLLYASLKNLGARWAQGSVWLYDGPLLPHQIRDILARSLDQNDDLMVVELGRHWATFRSRAAMVWFSVRSWFGRIMSK